MDRAKAEDAIAAKGRPLFLALKLNRPVPPNRVAPLRAVSGALKIVASIAAAHGWGRVFIQAIQLASG